MDAFPGTDHKRTSELCYFWSTTVGLADLSSARPKSHTEGSRVLFGTFNFRWTLHKSSPYLKQKSFASILVDREMPPCQQLHHDRVICDNPKERKLPTLLSAFIVLFLFIWVTTSIGLDRLGTQIEPPLLGTQRCPAEDHAMVHWHLDPDKLSNACGTIAGTHPFEDLRHRLHSCVDNDLGHGKMAPFFRVLGERHSGTNAVANLFYGNFDLDKSHISRNAFPDAYTFPVDPIDFGISQHKHDEQSEGVFQPGLTVVSLRNPYDWVRSLQKKCYGCEDRNKYSKLDSLRLFLNQSWSGGDHVPPHVVYRNLFDMRYRKLCNHVRAALTNSNCMIYLRQEDNILSSSKHSTLLMAARLTGWKLKNVSELNIKSTYHGHSKEKTNYLSAGSYIDSSLYFKSPSIYTEEDRLLIAAVNEHVSQDLEEIAGFLILPL